ncbi:MAG: hypothetical protein U9N36_07380 [Euryarchaeota archaeon]|nr:hypothetical protein [Euryarchaeota archaeon]
MTMKKFSREIDVEYVKGGFWGGDKVVATIKNRTITFEERTASCGQDDVHTYTIVRAPYVSKDGFQFKVYHKGCFQ